jgi:hypothetical protein
MKAVTVNFAFALNTNEEFILGQRRKTTPAGDPSSSVTKWGQTIPAELRAGWASGRAHRQGGSRCNSCARVRSHRSDR